MKRVVASLTKHYGWWDLVDPDAVAEHLSDEQWELLISTWAATERFMRAAIAARGGRAPTRAAERTSRMTVRDLIRGDTQVITSPAQWTTRRRFVAAIAGGLALVAVVIVGLYGLAGDPEPEPNVTLNRWGRSPRAR